MTAGLFVRLSVRNPLADGIHGPQTASIATVAAGAEEAVASLDGIKTLRGAHNAQNAAAAVAVVRILGLDNRTIAGGLASFPGLPHRLEEVGRIGRVIFVNDSKATNADAAARALSSFNHIYWIVGGRPKSDGIAGLESLFPRVAKAFLIGESAETFARTLEGRLAYELSENLRAGGRGGDRCSSRKPGARVGRFCSRRRPHPMINSRISPSAAKLSGRSSRDLARRTKRPSTVDQPRRSQCLCRMVVDGRQGPSHRPSYSPRGRSSAVARRQPVGGRAARL